MFLTEKFSLAYIKNHTSWDVLENNNVRGTFVGNYKRYHTKINKTYDGYSMSIFVGCFVGMLARYEEREAYKKTYSEIEECVHAYYSFVERRVADAVAHKKRGKELLDRVKNV